MKVLSAICRVLEWAIALAAIGSYIAVTTYAVDSLDIPMLSAPFYALMQIFKYVWHHFVLIGLVVVAIVAFRLILDRAKGAHR